MSKGQSLPSEKRELRDIKTGVTIWRMANHPSINHSLYFLNPSWTADGETVLFVSYRSGAPNLYMVHEESGEIVQVTDMENFHPISAYPDRSDRRVFFTAGEEVRVVDLESLEEEVLATFHGARIGNCHLSSDGRMVVTAVRKVGSSAIVVVRTDGSGADTVIEVSREVGHVQFCPVDSNVILYSSDITQRMWLVHLDGSENRPLYAQRPDEWITHESWRGDSDQVIFVHWPYALMIISKDSDKARPLARLNCWHPSSRADGSLMVCDTVHPDGGLQLIRPQTGEYEVFCYPESSSQGTQWPQSYPATGKVEENTYGPQRTHPHPSFSPDGRKVIYTSDRTGYSQVYVAILPSVD